MSRDHESAGVGQNYLDISILRNTDTFREEIINVAEFHRQMGYERWKLMWRVINWETWWTRNGKLRDYNYAQLSRCSEVVMIKDKDTLKYYNKEHKVVGTRTELG